MFNLFKPRVRTRFAPSPTGYVHLGSLRSALFEYLFAKKNRGIFYLRIEDTDQSREVAGATENLLKVLKWAGIEPDEGVCLNSRGKASEKGKYGPYTQSKRLNLYQKYASQLVDRGHAYYCFCTQERLEALRREQEEMKLPTRYDGMCKKLSSDEVKSKLARGDKRVIRMSMPKNREFEFTDMIRGPVKFNSNELDEQVLLKADGYPTYHLAHVVDDHLMKTTHVIRGEEWLPSTPKHLALFEYFGWTPPQYAHLPLILNPDKSKLSKRQGDVAVEDFRDKGYLPEALINYVALLGWNPGTEQEIFSLRGLIKEFSFSKVHKAGAVFDVKKLDWINAEYIKKMPFDDYIRLARPHFDAKTGRHKLSDNQVNRILALEQTRISKLSEIGQGMGFFLSDKLDYEPRLLVWRKSDSAATKNNLKLLMTELEKFPIREWEENKLEAWLLKFVKDKKLTNGDVLWPLRVALTGLEKSPTPFAVAAILGKETSLHRINDAIMMLR